MCPIDGPGAKPRGTQPLALPQAMAQVVQQVVEQAKVAAAAQGLRDDLVLGEADAMASMAEATGTGWWSQAVEVAKGLITPKLQPMALPDHCMAAGFAAMLEAKLGPEAYEALGEALLKGEAVEVGAAKLAVPEAVLAEIRAGKAHGSQINAAVQAAIQALGARLDGSQEGTEGIRVDALSLLNQVLGVELRVATSLDHANVGDFLILEHEGKAHLTQVAMVEDGVVHAVDGRGEAYEVSRQDPSWIQGWFAPFLPQGGPQVVGVDAASDLGIGGDLGVAATASVLPAWLRGQRGVR